jgi:hypothetical protein
MLDIPCIALDQSPIVSDPIKALLNLPSMAVAGARAEPSSMLESMPDRRNRRLDATPSQKVVEGPGVLRLVRGQIPGPCAWARSLLWHLDHRRYQLGQHAFMRLCTIYMQPDGQATAVSNAHSFSAFARFGFANAKVPFLASTKCSSTRACAHSILPWAFNRSITPAKSALTSQVWTKSRSVASRLQVSRLRVAHLPERI